MTEDRNSEATTGTVPVLRNRTKKLPLYSACCLMRSSSVISPSSTSIPSSPSSLVNFPTFPGSKTICMTASVQIFH